MNFEKNSMYNQQQTITEYKSIDLFKLICAILVITIHIAPLGLADDVLTNDANYFIKHFLARFAVPFFFTTSGYLLYLNNHDQNNFRVEPIKKCLKKLFKVYVVWSVIYLPCTTIDILHSENKLYMDVLLYVQNFIFGGAYIHLWYVKSALVAIAIVSFLLYKKKSVFEVFVISLILYIIGLFGQTWFGIIVPLKNEFPSVWQFFRMAQDIILTTRNGLFDGMLFISLGLCLAVSKKISFKKNIILFVLSVTLYFIEFILVRNFDLAKDFNTYLGLVPSIYFGFQLILRINLTNWKSNLLFRKMSSLIYFCHPLVITIICKIVISVSSDLLNTPIPFISTLVVTVAISLFIIRLSKLSRLSFLKKLF